MNTTAPRARAGKPYVMPLHRAQPIDFVMSDEEEQEVRNGYDMAMKAALSKPQHVETASAEDEGPADFASFRPLVIAGLVLCIVGFFYWGFA